MSIFAVLYPIIAIILVLGVAVLTGLYEWLVKVCTRLDTPGYFIFSTKEEALRETLYQRRIHPQHPVIVNVVHCRDVRRDDLAREAIKYSKVL